MAIFDLAIEKTLAHEGGYVNDPDDKGGETKFGISKRSYPEIDIAKLTRDEAAAIYKRDYWDEVKGDDIDSQVIAEHLFDTAVNMGVNRAAKMGQRIVGATDDGRIGPQSVAAFNECGEIRFDDKYRLAKISRYAWICNKNGDQKKFLLGWINRALS